MANPHTNYNLWLVSYQVLELSQQNGIFRWEHSQLSSGHQLKPLTQSCPSPAMASRNNFRRPGGFRPMAGVTVGGNVPWKKTWKMASNSGKFGVIQSLESRTLGFPWISRVTSYFFQGNNQFGWWCNRWPQANGHSKVSKNDAETWICAYFCHQIFSAECFQTKKFDRKNRPGWFPTEGMWSESPWHRHLCRQFLPAGGPRGCSYSIRRMEVSLQAIDSTPDVNPTHQGLLGSFGWHLDLKKYICHVLPKRFPWFFSMFRCSKKGEDLFRIETVIPWWPRAAADPKGWREPFLHPPQPPPRCKPATFARFF